MENSNEQGKCKVAIIGIGSTRVSYGIVASLLQQDATVVVPAQSSHQLKNLEQYLKGSHTGRLVTVLTDLPDYDKTIALAEMVIEEYGPPDIVVFPFDYPWVGGSLSSISIDQWERALQENLTVYLNCSRVAISVMKERGKGMFVAIIDTDSFAAQGDNALDEMLMGGQMKMARSFFEEVKNTGVKFYHLFTNNLDNHQPGGKAITPEMIGRYILYLSNGYTQQLTPFLFLMGKPNPDLDHLFKNN
jgi:NAD(P)-dependent dehydrogenase (short-subunit alcohol dehydrogenase family)